ncbi:HPP family protein [Thioalkalivibrio sp. AKL19]|uniref:HPP family protein n=1 Tax=Thioalkalivibrio sp. AKL19 TaxID=1266914 RepID=UPI00041C5009|nr:HPP family protein [Thioalkalivibrio sp. AKL19]
MRTGRGSLFGDFLDTTNHWDKLIALVGAIIGLYLSLEVAASVTENGINGLILASLGATAVLLFAAPHAALSQPWNVLGGHGVAAIVGVLARDLLPHPLLAAAFAVGLAIWLMHYLRCLHPPGGATALYAVVGGDSVAALGPWFLLHPVLSSVGVMLLVAVIINYPFPWRRYPARLTPPPESPGQPPLGALEQAGLGRADLEHAMREMNLYLDLTEDDLARLYLLARRHHHHPDPITPNAIRPGTCFSNGKGDADWAVRRVLEHDSGYVTYRNLAGPEAPHTGRATLEEFLDWAHHQLVPGDRTAA